MFATVILQRIKFKLISHKVALRTFLGLKLKPVDHQLVQEVLLQRKILPFHTEKEYSKKLENEKKRKTGIKIGCKTKSWQQSSDRKQKMREKPKKLSSI